MKKNYLNLSQRNRILLTMAYLLLIYSSLPFSRNIVSSLRELKLLQFTITASFLLVGGSGLWAMIFYFKLRSPNAYILLSCLASVLTYFVLGLEVVEERVHFIQYGLLAIGVVYSFSPSVSGVKLYFLATIVTGICGYIDEAIQYVLPMRYFDWRDVGFNCLASIFGVGFSLIFRAYVVQQTAIQPMAE